MIKENKNEIRFCIYCNKEIQSWEEFETVQTKRKCVRHFHLECYKRQLQERRTY